MLIIIERDRFIKLFKLGELKVSINRFIDGYGTIDQYRKISIDLIDAKTPFFEQDHELLILEILKEALTIDYETTIKISQVRRIFPLSDVAKQYLIGKINPHIILHEPILDEQIKELKIKRDFRLRIRAKDSLLSLFGIHKSHSASYDNEIEQGIKARITFADNSKKSTYLFHLLNFNRNPVYPSGSIEYIFKAASVFVEMKGGTEKDFESGPFYKFLKANLNNLFGRKLSECITFVLNSKESEPIKSELKKQYPELDAFIVGVWFLYFKDKLNKNEYDLGVISEEIISLKESSPKEIAVILLMLGMLFSFDNLYESIYKIRKIPIFNITPKLGHSERNDELLSKLQAKEVEVVQLKKENAELRVANAGIPFTPSTALVKLEEQDLIPKSQSDSFKKKEIISEKPKNELKHRQEKVREKDSNHPKTVEEPATVSRSRKNKPDLEPNKTNKKSGKKKQSKKDEVNLFTSSPKFVETKKKTQYNEAELKEIVSLIKKNKLLKDKKELETVCNAILINADKGCNYDQLSNEIEVLKKDHGFTEEVAKRIISIIKEVKDSNGI